MAERIPGDAQLLFIQAARTGTVHLYVRLGAHHLAGRLSGQSQSIAAMFSTPTVTRCGERTFPHGIGARHEFVSSFSDDRLCAACYRTLHPDDQERAFDHEQPEGEGEGDDRERVA